MTQSPDVLLRPYVPQDFVACLAIFDGNAPDFFALHERAEFRTFLLGGPATPYLVLECAGEIVASGGVSVDPWGWATMDWGMVARHRQRGGLGRRLLTERIALVRGMAGAVGIRLETSQKSRGFYEGFGFEVARVVTDGLGRGLDGVAMVLRFD